MSARQAIHDAYLTGVGCINYLPRGNSRGFNSDVKIMLLVEQGYIQRIMDLIKNHDVVAYTWALWAYAPTGTITLSETFNKLFPYARQSVMNSAFNPFQHAFFGALVLRAMQDSALDARTGKRNKQSYDELARICRCSKDEYKNKYRFMYYKIKDAFMDKDAIALPPIAALIHAIANKQSGDRLAHDDFVRLLRPQSGSSV